MGAVRLGSLVLLTSLLWAYATSASAAVRTYGLVVGNNQPPAGPAGDGLSTLRYADDDAVRYDQLLRQFADEVRLHTVLDGPSRQRWPSLQTAGPPTLAAVLRSLADLSAEASEHRAAGDRVVFYLVLSAHGAIGDDGDAFVSLLDAPLSRAVLFDDVLAPLPADRVHLIIDACHAAGVVGLRGKRGFGTELDASSQDVGAAEAERWLAERTLDRFPHVGVLAATTATEQAHEWSAIESGVFSHEVLSALWGAGDINGDRRVEYSEVQAFISNANRRVDDPRAVPQVVARPAPDDPHDPLSDLSSFRESVTIVGDASSLGHFHIDGPRGQRHLDANLGSGSIAVAVPAGDPSYLRAGDAELELRGHAGETLSLEQIPRRATEVDARGSIASTYRRDLFEEPYTPDYYRGYVDSIGGVPVPFALQRPEPPAPLSPRPSTNTPGMTPPTVDQPRRRSRAQRRRAGGVTFAVLAGSLGVTSLVTGVMAGRLRAQFNATSLEAPAHELARQHQPLATTAILTGAAFAVTTTAAVLLIRSAKRDTRR